MRFQKCGIGFFGAEPSDECILPDADEHVAVENWLWVLLGKVDLVFYLFLFSLPAETFTSEQLKVEQKMKYEEILSVFSLTW